MNVLITNTHADQSYAIVCALRPHADKVVATMEGGGISSRFSQTAVSRLVDRRVRVPSPVADWRSGIIQRQNTDREDSYIAALVEICERESIDVIFPSWDPHVYVLSKNKPLFEKMNIVVPVPNYDTVIKAVDKYETIQAAESVGFPCPRTYLYENPDELKSIAKKQGFPLVIKPRAGSGGKGLAIVSDLPELLRTIAPIEKRYGKPMIQEYIPGKDQTSFPVLLDRRGEVKFSITHKNLRNFRVTSRFATVQRSTAVDSQLLDSAAKLLKQLGWWGTVSVSGLYDPRDGLFKLMEINPRFPRRLWRSLAVGVNEPLMCLAIARGESVEPVKRYPTGSLFVSPIDDALLLGLQILDTLAYKIRVGILRRHAADRHSRPKPLSAVISSFLQTYTGNHKKVFDLHFTNFVRDPLASMLWWLRFSMWMVASFRHLGK